MKVKKIEEPEWIVIFADELKMDWV